MELEAKKNTVLKPTIKCYTPLEYICIIRFSIRCSVWVYDARACVHVRACVCVCMRVRLSWWWEICYVYTCGKQNYKQKELAAVNKHWILLCTGWCVTANLDFFASTLSSCIHKHSMLRGWITSHGGVYAMAMPMCISDVFATRYCDVQYTLFEWVCWINRKEVWNTCVRCCCCSYDFSVE